MISYRRWAAVRRAAQSRKLGFCVCMITRRTDGYKPPTKKENLDTNRDKGDDFRDWKHPVAAAANLWFKSHKPTTS